MPLPILGIHHVTAVAGDPRKDDAFYRQLLGMRRVKVTTNFDDPTTYHLYYGDAGGRPGSLWTTFPHPRARRGRPGIGEANTTAFSVPPGSLDFWETRLKEAGITSNRTGDTLAFEDADGMSLALVEGEAPDTYEPPAGVEAKHAIRCFDHVALHVENPQETADFITNEFGYRDAGDGLYLLGDGQPSRRIRITKGDGPPPMLGAGRVHHVAFRVENDEKQKECLDHLAKVGIHPTPVQERQYFRSIYFRIPGGILFEIATDPPGMAIDEPLNDLGNTLMLPPWNEPYREQIAAQLIPLPNLRGVGEATPGRSEA